MPSEICPQFSATTGGGAGVEIDSVVVVIDFSTTGTG